MCTYNHIYNIYIIYIYLHSVEASLFATTGV